ncbi:MAG: hypothetical protein AAFX94_18020, partial [Myxococcota bacterium]
MERTFYSHTVVLAACAAWAGCTDAAVDTARAPSSTPSADEADSSAGNSNSNDDIGQDPPARPLRVEVPTLTSLVSGAAGEPWSVQAARGYATQATRPYLNGGFGSTTARCGLGGPVIAVTHLGDSGPGSLRHAVEEVEGPRTVVFEVSGAIAMQDEIDIEEPFLTIAGQTAPAPGISLHHAGVVIRTREVCIQHLRIRVGDRRGDGTPYPPGSGDQIDALSIRNNRGLDALNNIIIDNVSLSWSSDEMFSFDRENIFDVTIRDTLMAEPLNDNLHDSGTHAYCALLASRAGLERVSFIANVMAHCIRRSPRVDEGTVVLVNNFSYNPGVYAIQLFGNDPSEDLYSTLVGNWMAYPDEEALRWAGNVDGNRGTVRALVQNFYTGADRTVRLYMDQNTSALGRPVHLNESAFQTTTTASEF